MTAGLFQLASSQTSAFGLARVAAPATLFALSHEYTAHPLIWDPTTSGTGAIAHTAARGIGASATLGVTVPFGEEY